MPQLGGQGVRIHFVGEQYPSIEQAIGASTVGKYVDTRLQQITAQVNAELGADRIRLAQGPEEAVRWAAASPPRKPG
mgnify:CR=1 FL=1